MKNALHLFDWKGQQVLFPHPFPSLWQKPNTLSMLRHYYDWTRQTSLPKPGVDKEAIAQLPPIQLYNMKDDPTESKNVYQEHPEIVSELKDLLQKYIREGRSTPGKAQSNDAVNKWEQIKGIMHDDWRISGRKKQLKALVWKLILKKK